jgi:hypothetical protein
MCRVSSSCSTGVTRPGTLVQYICVMLWLCDNASWKCQFISWKCQFTSWKCQFTSEISISLTKIWSSQLIIKKSLYFLSFDLRLLITSGFIKHFWLKTKSHLNCLQRSGEQLVWFMVSNATFNNISDISWGLFFYIYLE